MLNSEKSIEMEIKWIISQKKANEILSLDAESVKTLDIVQVYLFDFNSELYYNKILEKWELFLFIEKKMKKFVLSEKKPLVALKVFGCCTYENIINNKKIISSSRLRFINNDVIFTIKVPIDGVGYYEFESTVTTSVDADLFLQKFKENSSKKIIKTRSIIKIGKLVYEFDYLKNVDILKLATLKSLWVGSEPLCLLEVEFETELEMLAFKPFFDFIDVSNDAMFKNKNMANDTTVEENE